MANTIRVTMTETHDGSEDGHNIKTYNDGETYDMAAGLASIFLRAGYCEKTRAVEVKPSPKSNKKSKKSK